MFSASAAQTPPVGSGLSVEDVFSVDLYTGTGTDIAVTNGVDLAGEGGLVWIKNRDAAVSHALVDTARGGSSTLASDTAAAEASGAAITFASDGFSTVGAFQGTSTNRYVSYSFRKAPKFLDIVTYTGNATARTIAHNLQAVPAMIIVRGYAGPSATDWFVLPPAVVSGSTFGSYMRLNGVDAPIASTTIWDNTAPTDDQFSLGAASAANTSGVSYVAYLFASDAGGFGDGDAESIIKCGTYAGTGAITPPVFVDCGFEPQWLMIKRINSTGSWMIFDMMRGIVYNIANSMSRYLSANLASADTSSTYVYARPQGFSLQSTATAINNSASTYQYVAIRRPMKPPKSAADVFGISYGNASAPPNGLLVDSQVLTDAYIAYVPSASVRHVNSRIMSTSRLDTTSTGGPTSDQRDFDVQTGVKNASASTVNVATTVFASLRRARGFFDVLIYRGNGASAYSIPHNLRVTPELVVVKCISTAITTAWQVAFSNDGSVGTLRLDSTGTLQGSADASNMSASSITVGTSGVGVGIAASATNSSGYEYQALLFASYPGVSKIGTYTGNGASLNIDTGMPSGPRFVLVKAASAIGNWWVWDTVRGMLPSGGTDAHTALNASSTQGSANSIDPYAGGFTAVQNASTSINASGVSYLYLALA